jgi:hypothetical protein
MKQKSKFLLLVCSIAVVAGCKLAVIVVEGGKVLSENSFACFRDEICIVDVSDPTFSETFSAIPYAGWYFEMWNSGDRFFCGGSSDPTCTLSFEGYEESEAVQEVVASSETFYLMPVFKPQMHESTVEVDGKQWLQPTYFGYTRDQVRAVCPNGACSGNLPGSNVDLTGYIWASIQDVSGLFNAYGVDPPFTESFQSREDQAAAGKFFNDFGYLPDRGTWIQYGMVRDHASEHTAYITVVDYSTSGYVGAFTNTYELDADFGLGTWFWRPVK